MKRVVYLSPSTMPSRSANSVHVAMMLEALSTIGTQVVAVVQSSVAKSDFVPNIEDHYGIKFKNPPEFWLLPDCFRRGIQIWLGILGVACVVSNVLRGRSPDVVISRNLWSAWVLSWWIPQILVYEIHQLDYGFRKRIQSYLLKDPRIKKILISKKLVEYLTRHHGFAPANARIFHDAAKAGSIPMVAQVKAEAQRELSGSEASKWDAFVGYFGHLYKGRGVEVIEALSLRHPNVAFLVYGGNETEVAQLLARSKSPNLIAKGFVPPSRVPALMKSMDVLLMPYQKVVSIDSTDRFDTAGWMSPLKMFEYMSSGVPLISSKLPVLEEILVDEHNCLLADPSDPDSWSSQLNRVLADRQLSARLARNAYSSYDTTHNWLARVQGILEWAKS
jgi:glycosyltransferase involved in cell wall biosynthesis